MSSFFDDASLVMIPSGYKDQKVYSVKPLDGSGDLTFTRASGATRVASNGLIEKVRTNLILQSQTFDNASWAKSLVTITDNFDTAPNGTLTADRVVSAGGAFPQVAQARTVVSGTQYTASLYVKSDGTTQIAQVIIIGGNTVSFTPTNAWQRISTTFTAASSSATFVLATNSAIAPASSFVIWGAQLETGDIATDYIATTTAAVSVGPVSGLPRLDYLGSTCPRLLLEPQRTNLALWSEQINNAGWTKANSPTITTNIATAPDGYSGADGIQDTTGVTYKYIAQGLTVSANSTLTFSFFVKKETSETAYGGFTMYFQNGTPKIVYGIVNAVTGTVTYASSTLTPTTKVEDYGTYWRISSTATDNGSNTLCEIGYYSTLSVNGTALGVGAGSVRTIWGFQVEAGAYATSYIPTLGASVTRVADAASKTGISSLIGQTEGTIFVDFNHDIIVTAAADSRIQLSDGTAANWIFIGFPDGATKLLRMYVNNTSGALSFYSSTGVIQGRNKAAFAYKSGDFMVYLNGVQVASNTTAHAIPPCSRINLQGGSPTAVTAERENINQALLFKTRLTNAQLAELTTL